MDFREISAGPTIEMDQTGDIRKLGMARENRYHEIAAELGNGFGWEFHCQIMEVLNRECEELDRVNEAHR